MKIQSFFVAVLFLRFVVVYSRVGGKRQKDGRPNISEEF